MDGKTYTCDFLMAWEQETPTLEGVIMYVYEDDDTRTRSARPLRPRFSCVRCGIWCIRAPFCSPVAVIAASSVQTSRSTLLLR